MEKLDAIIFVKVLEQGYQILQNSSVPLIWDHVDEWDGAHSNRPLRSHALSDSAQSPASSILSAH